VETVVALLFAAPAGAIAIVYTLAALGLLERPAGSRLRHWREAARASGLTEVKETLHALSGRTGSLLVRISRYEGGGAYGTRIHVSGPGLPADVTVRPEGFGSSVRGAHVREIEVGDEGFDRAAWVEGPPALVRSLLDARTRQTLRGLFEGRLERPRLSPFWAEGRLDFGVLRVDVPEVVPPAPEDRRSGLLGEAKALAEVANECYVGGRDRLPEVLKAVLALARRLAPPEDVPARLAANLKGEPEAGVRRQCLTTLAREFPTHEATRGALLAARDDPDATVRLRAGVALGPRGRDVLLGVASGEGAEDATTEAAVVALGEHLTTSQAQGILKNALRTRREATARACLLALGRRGGREAVLTLAKVLAVERDALAVAAADALGATSDASAEAALLEALGSPYAKVRAAAARALGRVGSIAAVLPLKEAEARDRAVRAAARQAVAEIQSRARGAAPGQLSLAGAESGRLSLAPGEDGRLSFADPVSSPAPSAAGSAETGGE
jgi:HEAT repeat protein